MLLCQEHWPAEFEPQGFQFTGFGPTTVDVMVHCDHPTVYACPLVPPVGRAADRQRLLPFMPIAIRIRDIQQVYSVPTCIREHISVSPSLF